MHLLCFSVILFYRVFVVLSAPVAFFILIRLFSAIFYMIGMGVEVIPTSQEIRHQVL